ncbi:MAG: 2-oxoacid:ferredoxin oxidoreductase subunit alpha [Candidatus Asgardarchaeia archaeon]
MRENLLLMIGGPQGSGLETSAIVLTRAFANKGYNVFSDREYYSNIKGKHSYTHMRISARECRSLSYPVDLIVAMDAETVFTHFDDIAKGGYLFYDINVVNTKLTRIPSMGAYLKKRLSERFIEMKIDETLGSLINHIKEQGVNTIGLDYLKYLKELSKKYTLSLSVASKYLSAIAIGIVTAATGLEEKYVFNGIKHRLIGREKIIKHNMDLIGNIVKEVKDIVGEPLKLKVPEVKNKEILVASGNEIIAMGKIVGGLRLQTYYPITPAADESLYLESKAILKANGKLLGNIVVVQTEDELAAIASAIGGALTGARTATSTSGPGFSLMVEGFGWAGMTETPVVVTYYQRGGPSTGLPTRGAQSDLLFAMFAGHGVFPRIVLASGDHLEAFYDAIDAFNFAEKYQTPVIHLVDKFLANSVATIPIPDFSKIRIERGNIVDGDEDYKRFDFNHIISPRAFIGSKAIMWYTGDEHGEKGNIVDDPIARMKIHEKRMKKLEIADKEIPISRRAELYGNEEADILIVGWGSVKGVVLDAISNMKDRDISYLHLRIFSPFPKDYVKKLLTKSEMVIAIEHSYEAQIAKLIELFTGYEIKHSIVKYTGRPIYEHEVVNALRKILSEKVKKVVLSYGK